MTMINEQHRGSHEQQQQRAPVTSRAHFGIYAIAIALTVWFICAAWGFAGGGITDYLLVVISGFLCVAAIGLPLILFRVAAARPAMQGSSPPGTERPRLRDWMRWRYDTRTERLKGSDAAAQILLPIAAAAIGMTAIAIAYHFAGG